MSEFIKETGRIYRLKVPFMSVYTSVFLVKTENGAILVDCATTEDDVKDYIVPALKKLGYEITDINAIVITHSHSDHAGGLDTVTALAPDIKIVTGVADFGDGICTYPLAGHTEDFIGVFDANDGTLITGDGLQGAGIGMFRCSLETKSGYLETLEKIKNDTKVKALLFSHEYEPWYKNSMIGRENILNCLDDCKKYVK
jgi:glyoxylase-like metal-dependent hydrolase (beta-lactamase superfamily II)